MSLTNFRSILIFASCVLFMVAFEGNRYCYRSRHGPRFYIKPQTFITCSPFILSGS